MNNLFLNNHLDKFFNYEFYTSDRFSHVNANKFKVTDVIPAIAQIPNRKSVEKQGSAATNPSSLRFSDSYIFCYIEVARNRGNPSVTQRTGAWHRLQPRLVKKTQMDTRRPEQIRADKAMKVAIVHDWLPLVGGAERVLEQLMAMYPDADLYTLFDFLPRENAPFLSGRKVIHSRLQHVPFSKKLYRHMLPVLPMAIEQFNLDSYDLVVSSSSAVAKGVITSPDQLHVCYCHSPMRYAWDLQAQYLEQTGLTRGLKSLVIRYLLYKLRLWDVISSNRVDSYIANSGYIRNRINKTYRREAAVIHPPVDTDRFKVGKDRSEFYLAASRQVPYKRIDLIVSAFKSMPDRKLVVIGDGPEHKKVKALAGPNVEILGYQPDSVMQDYMGRAKAFIFAAQEDFGILPVEAQACGTPVIAFGRGGARETVLDKITGLLFEEQTEVSLIDAICRFERLQHNFRTDEIRRHAESFSIDKFREQMFKHIDELIAERAKAAVQPTPPNGVEHMRKFLQ